MNNLTSKYTIGVDFGTLSARAVLVDVKSGQVICDAVHEYRHGVIDSTLPLTGEALPADFALQDPADYIEAFRNVICGVLEKSGAPSESVIGLGIDFTCCTLIPVKADMTPVCFDREFAGNPHAYVKLWKHHAAQPYADKFNEAAAKFCPELLEQFGGKTSSEWLFPKVMEVLDKAPEVYERADYFMEAGDYLTWLLTGKQTRSYAFAAYKVLYHHEKGYVSKELLRSLDPRLENLAETKLNAPMVYTGEVAGYVDELARERFDVSPEQPWLKTGIAISCPEPDAHTAAAALNASHDGDMFAILGTSSNYMLISKDFKIIPGICGVVKDGLYPGFYAYESGLCCFGDHFAWAVNNVCPPEYHAEAQRLGVSDVQYISEKAAKLAPGESGVIALNWFNGNRNPLVDAALSGAFVGLTLQTKPEDIFRALVEANAFGTRLIIETFEKEGVSVERMTAAGGITFKSPFVMQLLADVLGKELHVSSYLHSSALSSAIYAAVAAGSDAGGYDLLEDACNAMSDPCPNVYRPNPEAHEAYNRLYEEYLLLVDYFGRGANDVMKRLRAISSEAKE